MRSIGTFATKAEADARLARETVQVSEGDWHAPERGRVLLGPVLRRWIENRADLAPSTRALYLRLLREWVETPLSGSNSDAGKKFRALGERPIGSVTPADIREWHHAVTTESIRRAHLRYERSQGQASKVNAAVRTWARENGLVVAATGRIRLEVREAWASATGGTVESIPPNKNAGHTEAAQAYRMLSAGLAQAVKDRLIRANPCSVTGAGQRDTRDRPERRTLSLEEARELTAAMPPRYQAAVIVSVLSGVRAGELFALQRKHVDLSAGTLQIEQSLARAGAGSSQFSSTKTAASRRTVWLPREAINALRAHMARFTPTGHEALVFGTSTASPLGASSRSQMFTRARASIGRQELVWHDLRHSALMIYAEAGATVAELMAVAGHASSRSAMHYQHVAQGAQERLAGRVTAMLAGSVESADPTLAVTRLEQALAA